MINERLDKLCFQIGRWIWLPIIIIGSLFSIEIYPMVKDSFSCSFYQATGFPCPGCGGTRAVVSLFHFHILDSFLYHPAVLCLFIFYFHFMCLYAYRYLIQKKNSDHEIRVPVYAYLWISVILIQWILKLVIQKPVFLP